MKQANKRHKPTCRMGDKPKRKIRTHVAVYYRISTKRQTTDTQKSVVRSWIENSKYKDKTIKEYEDIGFSGMNERRPALTELMADCKKGRVEAVIIYKIDRISRVAKTSSTIVYKLNEMNIDLYVVGQPLLSHDSPQRTLALAMYCDLAQMERDIHVERIKDGIESARRKGKVLGAPKKITDDKIVKILALRNEGKTIRNIAESVGVSTGSVSSVLKGF